MTDLVPEKNTYIMKLCVKFSIQGKQIMCRIAKTYKNHRNNEATKRKLLSRFVCVLKIILSKNACE